MSTTFMICDGFIVVVIFTLWHH